jgi:hypothetical protein
MAQAAVTLMSISLGFLKPPLSDLSRGLNPRLPLAATHGLALGDLLAVHTGLRSLCVKKNHLVLSPRGLPRRDNHSTFLFFWVPTKLPQITAVICTSNNTQSPLMDGKPIWKGWSASISSVRIHCAFHEVEINALHIIGLVRYIQALFDSATRPRDSEKLLFFILNWFFFIYFGIIKKRWCQA